MEDFQMVGGQRSAGQQREDRRQQDQAPPDAPLGGLGGGLGLVLLQSRQSVGQPAMEVLGGVAIGPLPALAIHDQSSLSSSCALSFPFARSRRDFTVPMLMSRI